VTARENRPTEGAVHEVPAKGPTDSLAESDLTSEDRQAAVAVGFEAGMHYQAGLDVEDRARALLIEWSRESRNMATRYAARVGPAWSALIAECGDRE